MAEDRLHQLDYATTPVGQKRRNTALIIDVVLFVFSAAVMMSLLPFARVYVERATWLTSVYERADAREMARHYFFGSLIMLAVVVWRGWKLLRAVKAARIQE
jgi:hypothetical protein